MYVFLTGWTRFVRTYVKKYKRLQIVQTFKYVSLSTLYIVRVTSNTSLNREKNRYIKYITREVRNTSNITFLQNYLRVKNV